MTLWLVLGLIMGGGCLFLGCGASLFYFLAPAHRNPLQQGVAGLLPNPRVTLEAFHLLPSGATLAEVEAILGPGRLATEADIDVILQIDDDWSRRRNIQARTSLVETRDMGLVYAWSNGDITIMALFHQHPNQGGRLLRKIIRNPDGSGLSLSDDTFLTNPNPTPSPTPEKKPNPTPEKKPSPKSSAPVDSTKVYTVAEILTEFAQDRSAAQTRYRRQLITITGTIDQILISTVLLKSPSGTGKVQVRMNAAEVAQLKRMHPGEMVTIQATMLTYTPGSSTLMLENGIFSGG